jgi:hypothetical protein
VSRGLNRRLLVVAAAFVAVTHLHAGSASSPLLQRFLAIDDPTPSQFRALRHLDATNDRFERSAWMDVWTEGNASGGFRYHIVSEGGSNYIQAHVFRPWLEREKKMWAAGEPDTAAVTPANYEFEAGVEQPDGLTSLVVKPRRKDVLLVEGSIFLNPHDGDLVRMEGRLSKSPSFWTRDVKIVRWYRRFAGIRMPVALESVSNVRIAGESTFKMTYEYESINGQRVGTPQVRAAK